MTHREKVKLWSRQAAANGLGRFRVTPLQWRIFWLVGWRLPPPHFLSFAANFLVFGASFALIWAAYLVTSRYRSITSLRAVVEISIFGVVFGAAIAGVVWYQARKLQLPRWGSYPA